MWRRWPWQPRNPRKLGTCVRCIKTMNSKQIHIKCCLCKSFNHIRCAKFKSLAKFQENNKATGGWFCQNCINNILPFFQIADQELTELIGLKKRKIQKQNAFNNLEADEKCFECK